VRLAVLKVSDAENRDYFELCIAVLDPRISSEIDELMRRYVNEEIGFEEFVKRGTKLFAEVAKQLEESVCIWNGDLDELNLNAEPEEFESTKFYEAIPPLATVKGYLVSADDWQDYISIHATVRSSRGRAKVLWIFGVCDVPIRVATSIP